MPRRDTGQQGIRTAGGWRWAAVLGAACLALAGGRAVGAGAPARADRQGDPLPAGALARLGTLRLRHGTSVTHLAFLPDGKAMLTASQDNVVRLWDLETGKEIRRFGKKPAANPGGGVGMVGVGVVVRGWAGPGFGGFSLALAPDGKTLAVAGQDNAIALYEVESGKELRTIKGPGMGMGALLFSPDGKVLAARSGASPAIHLWETATGKELRQLGAPPANQAGAVFFGNGFGTASMAFSPDGKTLAAGETNFDGGKIATSLRLWETATAKELRKVPLAKQTLITAVAYAPDGKTLAYAIETTLHICEAETGKELRQVPGQDNGAVNLVFSPDGKTLAVKGMAGTVVRLYDPETGKLRRQLGEAGAPNMMFLMGVAGLGRDLAFSPDGKHIATGGGSTVRLWETATGKEVGQEGSHRGSVNSVMIATGGELVASRGADNTVRLWEAATGKERNRFSVPDGTACVAFSPDGRLAAFGNADGTVRLHETTGGKEMHRLKGHANAVAAVAFAPDGKVVASRGASDNTIRLCDPDTGKDLRQIKLPGPDHAAGPGVVMVGLGGLGGLGMGGLGLAFSPDGRLLASPIPGNNVQVFPGGQGGTPTTINLWDTATGKEVRAITLTPQHGFSSFAFSPDGRTLAAENPDQTVSLWEVAGGKERARLGSVPAPAAMQPGQAMFVNVFGMMGMGSDSPTLAFASDGQTLAAKSLDGSVRVWDVPAAREIGPLKGHEGSITALAFSPDGRTLASGGSDTTILLWDVAGLARVPRPPAAALPARDVESLWADLAGDDAGKALQGIRKLAGSPKEAVPYFRERLKPAFAVDPKKIAQWVAGLDSEEFAVRQEAEQELEKLGELAVPALQKLLANPPSLEARKRAEQLVEKVTVQTLTTEQLRLVRALEVLEQVGTGEARQVLESLAKGAPGSLGTREAQAALDRLDRRSPVRP